ncbi:MAG TPA: HlyD family secretion protein [Myxococcales bacterium]|jgi:membrane fusion protein (multidrug efflux system)|nr:HlyD family secretion protein [Myxococcales bacterium]
MASATPLKTVPGEIHQEVDHQPVKQSDTPSAAPAAKRPKARLVFVGLAAAAALVALGAMLLGRGKEGTDDAQVEGRVVNVSSRVGGIPVLRVLVQDNQQVKAGDLLVELDSRDLQAKLLGARADVAAAKAALATAQTQLSLTEANVAAILRQARGGYTQASSGVSATRASLLQARADVAAAEAQARLAEADLRRARQLFEQKVSPQAELDAREARAEAARAALDQARAHLTSTEANLSVSAGGVEVASGRLSAAQTAPQQIAAAQAAVDAAEARLQQSEAAAQIAELNLSYTQVRAPVAGVVSRRTVEQGQLVTAERPLLALVPLDDVWIVANFKEDQIGDMKPGQRARVRIDAFGRRDFYGKVDSIAGASGARFALLPPDNSSGNFVKVVQRVPVLIRLDQPSGVQLRPGLSADAVVYIRD